MEKTLREIADFIGAKVLGDPNVLISGIAGIKEAKKGDIAFIRDSKYLSFINKTKASAVISSQEIKNSPIPVLQVANPSLAFAKIAPLFYPEKKICNKGKGVHPTAILGRDVKLGQDVTIGPYCVIEDAVVIGDNSVIYSCVYVGYDSKIGQNCVIHSNVSIREQTIIGNRVIIHNGTVIGSDGFGYEKVEGKHYKIPQLGVVVIEDDVEIGANVAIDRARIGKTVVGRGTKIDNLVQIAHNDIVGQNCIIVAQVGISGSVTIGDNAVIAGQAGIAGHLTIGDNAIIGAQAGVTKSVPADTFVSGYPARPHKQANEIYAYIQRLPRLNQDVEKLKSLMQKIKLQGKKKNVKPKNNKKVRRAKR